MTLQEEHPKDTKSILIDLTTFIPEPVQAACQKLTSMGYKAWLAGGCVRDLLLKLTPRDWDIVTNAPLEAIRKSFPKHLEVGVAFGIVKLPPSNKENPLAIDIAIFRKEEGYSDLRHPDHVEPGDENTDSSRRDFTINALFYDLQNKQVIDLVNGYKDLQLKILRTVGNPETRFSEDALRILRAARFNAQIGYKIEAETLSAMKKHSHLLKAISRERIREEMFRFLETSRVISGLEILVKTHLWEEVFGIRRINLPADLRHFKTPWKPTALDWLCAFATGGLLGNPQEEKSAIVERITQSLRFSNHEKQIFSQCLSTYEDSLGHSTYSPLEWVQLATEHKLLVDLLKLFLRRARGPTQEEKEKAISLLEQSIRWSLKKEAMKNWPNAQTLFKEGFKEGPKLGKELRLRHWQLFWTMPK